MAEKKQQFLSSDLNALVSMGALDFSFFQKNPETGKVDINKKALAQAFQIIDKKNSEKGKMDDYKLQVSDIKKRILAINPNFPMNEFNLFTGNKKEITFQELFELLNQNDLSESNDPLNEAITLLMDTNKNALDFDKLKKISKDLGYPDFTKKDIEILQDCLDIDKDGRISEKDFKEVLNFIEEQNQVIQLQKQIEKNSPK